MLAYAVMANVLDRLPRPKEQDSLRTAIPPSIQIFLAGGDRYLAANVAVFRALIVGTESMDADGYRILGRVQYDAARLNPYHEDNYYISQAILPWNGQLDVDLFIQEQATKNRTWDSLPPFFLGFDHYYFLHDPVAGAQKLQAAALHASGDNRDALNAMAARWYEKGDDLQVAANVTTALIKSTRDKEMKRHLEMRLTRVHGLMKLREAAKTFSEKYKRAVQDLNELIGPGLLAALPVDPLGQGYELDANGVPMFASSKPTNPKK
ncbi:MAG: hypothetical protein V4568_00990 [Pseudomonadota bacterium]